MAGEETARGGEAGRARREERRGRLRRVGAPVVGFPRGSEGGRGKQERKQRRLAQQSRQRRRQASSLANKCLGLGCRAGGFGLMVASAEALVVGILRVGDKAEGSRGS